MTVVTVRMTVENAQPSFVKFNNSNILHMAMTVVTVES
jgi:hypothetical protein